jgi:SRSO17 transposase
MNFAGRFADVFRTRGDSGERHARTYLQGLLSKEPAKNMERMAEVMEGTSWQNLQQFISDTRWDERVLWDRTAQGANARLGGHRDSMLVIDESAAAKQGRASVGVARQYNGRLGKTDNCQVGVFSVLTRGTEAAMVGARLYLPGEWVEDKERCLKAGVPEEEIMERTKIDLARELIDQAMEQKLDIKGVCFDSFYGRDQTLLAEVRALGLRVVADIPADTLVWRQKPGGGVRPRNLSASGAKRADRLRMPPAKKVTLRHGENGPVEAEISALRVWIWPRGSDEPLQWWLVFMVQSDGTHKHTLINAADDTRLEVLARWQGQRFFVEQTFKTAKSHLGAADYQVRKWRAWHHHMALVGLALLFLLEEKQDHHGTLPLLSAADVTEMLDYYFCRAANAEAVVRRILNRHRRRRIVTESKRRAARKRKTTPLGS